MKIKTFNEVAQEWAENKKNYVKTSTFALYVLMVEKHLLPAFGNKKKITENMLQEFVLKKDKEGLSQKTIKDLIMVFNMIIKFGAKRKIFKYEMYDIHFPKKGVKNKLEVLSRAEQKKIFEYVNENFTLRNLGIVIALNTGLRIGELCALKWDDINLDQGVIYVNKTIQRVYIINDENERYTKINIGSPKTDKSAREIPLTKDLIKTFKNLKKIVNPNFYVLSNESQPLEPRSYRMFYTRFLKKLNIPYIKFHALRHSFATRCIESGCDYKTVSDILGHTNISTTLNLYVHPNNEQKRKCIEKMRKNLGY